MLNFLMKQALKRQLKGLPQDQQEMILSAFDKNPDLFKRIAKETKDLTDKGVDTQTAGLTIMKKHQAELAELLRK
jgi:hypothetical protein